MRAVRAVLAGVVLVAAAAALSAPAARLRTVLVVPQGMRQAPPDAHVGGRDCRRYPRTCANGVGGVELAYAVRGAPPARTTLGTVLTDTNCDADRYGVSHCLNWIRLDGGRRILVRHDHSMMNDPCLNPGERVRVRRLGG